MSFEYEGDNRGTNFDSSDDEKLVNNTDFFEIYGSTPPNIRPRTRRDRKSRDFKQKMDNSVNNKRNIRLARRDRRNTLDCALLNQMVIEDEDKAQKSVQDKRSIHLQREFDREQKMSVTSTMPNTQRVSQNYEEHLDTVTYTPHVTIEPKLIESANRFMSVASRPVFCRISAPAQAFSTVKDFTRPTTNIPSSRTDFHETFSNLIKLGNCDKQEKNTKSILFSKEEQLWQTEVKDLIWLELKANLDQRSLEQQDKFTNSARQNIPELLHEIMNYRFNRKLSNSATSVKTADSGISEGGSYNDNSLSGFCFGCLSMYCKDCLESQTIALKQIESLLTRLESAEGLFPSSKAMGLHFSLYKSPEFVGRVKAMCLWYNVTRHHRLKLLILGKVLAKLQGKNYKWPLLESDSGSEGSSIQETDNDSMKGQSQEPEKQSKVQFLNIDETDEGHLNNNTDSANSEESLKQPGLHSHMGEYGRLLSSLNNYKLEPANSTNPKCPKSPYRHFIENVLKSRGLGKSLSFLHKLHNVVLRKAQITLEKPGTEDIEDELFDDDANSDIPNIEIEIDKEQESELRKYGMWSNDAIKLALPSYVSVFIFLSLIPLEVIQEFLKMKLETKPKCPNPLSLEQLKKELKEGITLALIHEQRFKKHIATALVDREKEMESYLLVINEFDLVLKDIFELYLEYSKSWILTIPDVNRKHALDLEWKFTKLTSPMIKGEHSVAAKKFCKIVESLLNDIGEKLITTADDLEKMSSEAISQKVNVVEGDEANDVNDVNDVNDENYEDESTIAKNKLLTLCRDTQKLFTDENQKCKIVLSFLKVLLRDLEKDDFHRDHNSLEDTVCLRHSTIMCPEVLRSINSLKHNALLLREKLTETIHRVQERCEEKYLMSMDDVDKQTVLIRTREILNQGYKFGFEYHKELSKIFETKTAHCRNSECEKRLSQAIISFSRSWMFFVLEKTERGRGVRPKWAALGLDFLIIASDPTNTKYINDEDFAELKLQMDSCISHVIGSISEPERLRKSPRSRKSSPAPIRKGRPSLTSTIPQSQKLLLQQISLREKSVGLSPSLSPDVNDYPSDLLRKQNSCDNDIFIKVPEHCNYTPELRKVKIKDAVNKLDLYLEQKLRDKNLIGYVKEQNSSDKSFRIHSRSVNFSWHRGIKIGQGRFGKVYTAVNNLSGELMAMKEISIQAGETGTIKNVAEELKIFEGISHCHLVKYFGVEIHREELLIFMELCAEGTLESLCELSGGLHEGLIRRYTNQLLQAVEELHKNLVVHRDIKCANIFLSNQGNCLKLGDFGSAVKIQFHNTMPGELKGYVGTQAYMAPEVFTKTNTDGHGRAADIWSVGCCVIEMASGKRPWHNFDSNFQIMFKVGCGEIPEVPSSLSDEGQDFVLCCLFHDPVERWSAEELVSSHNFCKVVIGDDCEDYGGGCSKK